MRNKIEIEFLELKQGDRSVDEYDANFIELARFAQDYVNSEAQKAKRFQLGLKPEIQSGVVILQLKTYTSVVQASMFGKNGDKGFRRQSFLQIGLVTLQSVLTKSSWSGPISECKQCGKRPDGVCKANIECFKCGHKGHYASECKMENSGVTCYNCGKIGHLAKNCRGVSQDSMGGSASKGPASSTPKARTFKMTKRSTAQDPDVVPGTLFLNFIPVKVLIESGVSKLFKYG
ncbi:uncharacterized protein LOC141660449 [Apium graveolens]|uniref:uncharacterized protein LOC141660449 n=1 Tax=Apium graveolens TaxID=4045 RepID=UPI003D7B2B00